MQCFLSPSLFLFPQCENIVEDQEDTIMELFAKENMENLDIEFCSKRWEVLQYLFLLTDVLRLRSIFLWKSVGKVLKSIKLRSVFRRNTACTVVSSWSSSLVALLRASIYTAFWVVRRVGKNMALKKNKPKRFLGLFGTYGFVVFGSFFGFFWFF